MGKIAIYCRVSTGLQNTDRQRTELVALAEKQKIEIDEDNIYEDIVSGFSKGDERPEYTRLMQDVNAGIIGEIWFHELTRMARSSIELLEEIKRLNNIGIKLFFLKQNLTVDPNNPSDIGQKILLSVLAVTAEYEVELFAERSMSGKIRKIQEGYGITADSHAFGYTIDSNKKMMINEDEAQIVRRIFTMYADGLSTIQIADILNSEGVGKKGLKWKAGVITKILNKKLYLGHRKVEFHKPIVNKEVREQMHKKGECPELLYTYDLTLEYLRIIDDVLFQRVQNRLKQAPYNKDNATKHESLLIKKIRCGECGSNFTVGKGVQNSKKGGISGERTYRCYGRINRKDKPATCHSGAEVRQWRLDGLVLMLSLRLFAEININEDAKNKLHDIEIQLKDISSIIKHKQEERDGENSAFKTALKRLIHSQNSEDTIIQELIQEEEKTHNEKVSKINKELTRYQKEVAELEAKKKILQSVSDQVNLYHRMHDIRNNKTMIKTMIDEFIEKVSLYKIDKQWNLVIVNYINGYEFWGTIKNARYKNTEMFYDELLCYNGVELKTWVINNTDKNFSYNPATRTVSYNGKSEIYTAIKAGEYDYHTFNKILTDTEWIGSFPLYDFENGADIPIPEVHLPERW